MGIREAIRGKTVRQRLRELPRGGHSAHDDEFADRDTSRPVVIGRLFWIVRQTSIAGRRNYMVWCDHGQTEANLDDHPAADDPFLLANLVDTHHAGVNADPIRTVDCRCEPIRVLRQ